MTTSLPRGCTPEQLDAAFAWLDRQCSIAGGDDSLRPLHLQGYFDQLSHEWRQMRTDRDQANARAADADRRIHDLAVQVQAALDTTDPDQDGALIRFMHAVNALPAVQAARRPAPAPRTPA